MNNPRILDFDLLAPERVLSDLNQAEDQVDQWIVANFERFDPFDWERFDERTLRHRVFPEAALYLYVIRGYGDTPPAPDLKNLVIERANDPLYYQLSVRDQSNLLKYLPPIYYAKLEECLTAEAAATIDSVLDGRAVWAAPRAPYQQLELWHGCQVYGYERCALNSKRSLELSSIHFQPDVINSNSDDAYILSHNIFYCLDFGIDSDTFKKQLISYDTEELIVGLILRYMAQNNFDLVLELLIAGMLQEQLPADIVRLVVSWVCSTVDQLGYVPGLDPRHGSGAARLEQRFGINLSRWRADEQEWVYNYHANIVFGMATRIVRNRWPELKSRSPSINDESAIREVLEFGQLLNTLAEPRLGVIRSQVISADYPHLNDRYPTLLARSIAFLDHLTD